MSYLEVCDVSKRIGSEQVLDSVSFSVERGEVVGLEGKNGSGKTMAMRVVCGLVRPSSGAVVVGGRELWSDISFPPSVGLLIEESALLGGDTPPWRTCAFWPRLGGSRTRMTCVAASGASALTQTSESTCGSTRSACGRDWALRWRSWRSLSCWC